MYRLGPCIALPHLSLSLAAAQTACISFFRTQKPAHSLSLQNSMTVATAVAEVAPSPPTAAEGDVPPFLTAEALDAHVERAWAHFRSLGSPKWHVAPMVDQVLRSCQRQQQQHAVTTNNCCCCFTQSGSSCFTQSGSSWWQLRTPAQISLS